MGEQEVQFQTCPGGGDGSYGQRPNTNISCKTNQSQFSNQNQKNQNQFQQSNCGGGGDLICKPQSQQPPKCRKLGEYDPNWNPCRKIPGNNPFHPPGQVIGILPKGYIRDSSFPRPINKPCAGPPPRLPWKQCVENPLINDQVRRPLARWCHIRELPPIVIPNSEIDRIKDKIEARSQLKAMCEAEAAQRECARQASYQRHSEWNHTVDSLLARKKKEEEDAEKQLEKEFFQLSKTIKENRDKHSAEEMARAKQKLLYRNGLIRDFHAAMALSKTLKEAEDEKKLNEANKRNVCKFPEDKKCDDPCQARLMLENDRVDYTVKKVVPPKECNPELLELLRCDEKRVAERQVELDKEKEKMKQLRHEVPLAWQEVYVQYTQEPKCEEGNEDCKKKMCERKTEIFNEIHDHLANDAFIEYTEKEIERQACEYNQYKRKVDRLRKKKEKEIIDERVARNIRNSEKAAEALMAAKAQQKTRTDEYSRLKEIWEAEHIEFAKQDQKWRQGLIERAADDYIRRKDIACCKAYQIDASQEWEKEQLNAVQNYERECEISNAKLEKAKEISKYQLEQIAEKVEREEAERGWNAAWGEKARMNYACEMREMKDYAMKQIEDWKSKGRPTFPMTHAMKKWDYEYGMNPFLYAQTPCTDETCPPYESTAQRLGFCNGGT